LLLVAEDDSALRSTIEIILEEAGYRVLSASDGQEALETLEACSRSGSLPRLIILDMRMPVMDGWQFMTKFRERYGSAIPVVVCTAAEDAAARAEEVEAEGVLPKPFDIDSLVRVVENVLRNRGKAA
jgi:CheY-like chemotaxis protein